MSLSTARLSTLTLLIAIAPGCARRVQDVESPYRAALEQLEESLGRRAPRNAFEEPRAPGAPFEPTGTYVEGDVIWAFSSQHREQLGFRLEGGRFVRAGTRTGPRETTRCIPGTGRHANQTRCLGRSEIGGFKTVGAGTAGTNGRGLENALETRGGYRDFAQLDGGQLVVIDDFRHQVISLDSEGKTLWTRPAPPASSQVGALSGGRFYLLSGTRPHVSVYDASGRRTDTSTRVAPSRGAAFDPQSQRLYLVGPENTRVRRRTGPIEHLSSELTRLTLSPPGTLGYDTRVDLGALDEFGVRLADATAVAVSGKAVAVALTGSDRLFVRRSGAADELVRVGAAPWTVAPFQRGFVGVSRLDDELWFVKPGSNGTRISIELSANRQNSLEELGERLFFGTQLWQGNSAAAYTCNSCHWDKETDHRSQPGFRERRWEITRGLDGIGAVRPIFSTGGAKSLSRAIEGLIRGLDERMWSEGPTGYWDSDLVVETPSGARKLGPAEVRRALLTYLMSLPVRPGPLSYTRGASWSERRVRGARLFDRDCASCHRPSPSLRDGHALQKSVPWAKRWRDGSPPPPLAWGAPAFSDAATGARFTPNGNRISPLFGVARRGPFYVTGRTASLEALISELRPGTRGAHSGMGPSPYSAGEREALLVFLASL